MVEQLQQRNVIELLSTTESPEMVINHEFIMTLLRDSLHICLGAAGTEKLDNRAVRMRSHGGRGQDKGVTKIMGHII